MRYWLLGDIHFGLRSNSLEWLEIQKDYFYNFFITNVKKYKQNDDELLILGDIFDNRQYVNILIMHEVRILMKDLLKYFNKIHIIVGNHDVFKKGSNDVTSLECIEDIKNIFIYRDPYKFTLDNKECLFIPWRKDDVEMLETISKYGKSDYMFCHSEVRNVKLNAKSVHEEGLDISAFKNFNKIYSGHIHYSQIISNINFLGNPLQMTRSDIDNKKGIYIIDFKTDTEYFIENNYSPKFIKINLDNILEYTLEDFKSLIKNNFVDFYVSSKMLVSYPINLLLEKISNIPKRIDIIPYEETIIEEDNDEKESEDEVFDILTLSKKHINNLSYNKNIKDKLLVEIEKLYFEVNEK